MKKTNKKLTINAEVVRNLSTEDMERAAGARSYSCPEKCGGPTTWDPTECNTYCPTWGASCNC